MTLSEKIIYLRKQCNMSQEDLAKKVGVKRQTIFKYEKGIIGDLTLSKLDILAKALNVPTEYLADFPDSHNVKHSIDKATLQFREIIFSDEELREIEDYIHYILNKRNTK